MSNNIGRVAPLLFALLCVGWAVNRRRVLLSAPLLWTKDHDDPRAFPPHVFDPLTGPLVQNIASDEQCAGRESLGVNAPTNQAGDTSSAAAMRSSTLIRMSRPAAKR